MGVRFVSLGALLGASACVTSFSGSDVQIDFASATQTIARPGQTPAQNQPPPNTYYVLQAVQLQRDATGNAINSYLFEVQRFEIQSLINTSSPCFIEDRDSHFPGLHSTMIAAKYSEQTGITNPFTPPAGASKGDITDVLDAEIRVMRYPAMETTVKAVTQTSTAAYGPSETTCVEDNPSADRTKFPPPKCIGEQSNALRLQLCTAFWQAHPDFYEGSDKVFTLPLNSRAYGFVEGANPVNGAFIGGSEFLVDSVLDSFDGYLISWQYKDLNGDGTPDFPDGTPEGDKKDGHLYMRGGPMNLARGVINVQLANPVDNGLAAQMAIFADIANDGTHF